jgi:hypothetical protein
MRSMHAHMGHCFLPGVLAKTNWHVVKLALMYGTTPTNLLPCKNLIITDCQLTRYQHTTLADNESNAVNCCNSFGTVPVNELLANERYVRPLSAPISVGKSFLRLAFATLLGIRNSVRFANLDRDQHAHNTNRHQNAPQHVGQLTDTSALQTSSMKR